MSDLRTVVAQWLMDQFDGDRHLSPSGHTIKVTQHPESDMWFRSADDLLTRIAADRVPVIPEGWELVRVWKRDDTGQYSAELNWIGDERFGRYIKSGPTWIDALTAAIAAIPEGK